MPSTQKSIGKSPSSVRSAQPPGASRSSATRSQQLRPRSPLSKVKQFQQLDPQARLGVLNELLAQAPKQREVERPNLKPGPKALSIKARPPAKEQQPR
jgi:hypothetical protein